MCLLPFREKTTLLKQSQPLLPGVLRQPQFSPSHVRSMARTSKFSNSTTVRKIRNFNLLRGRFALLSLPPSSSLCAPGHTLNDIINVVLYLLHMLLVSWTAWPVVSIWQEQWWPILYHHWQFLLMTDLIVLVSNDPWRSAVHEQTQSAQASSCH